jgi:hypothetical protein
MAKWYLCKDLGWLNVGKCKAQVFFLLSLGTLLSSCELVALRGGVVLGCVVLFELTELNGAARLPVKCFSLLQSWNFFWGKIDSKWFLNDYTWLELITISMKSMHLKLRHTKGLKTRPNILQNELVEIKFSIYQNRSSTLKCRKKLVVLLNQLLLN